MFCHLLIVSHNVNIKNFVLPGCEAVFNSTYYECRCIVNLFEVHI